MDLIINTRGASLCVENGCFVVSSGDNTQKVSANDIQSIYLQRGILVTTDAMFLAIENEINIFVITSKGFPVGRLSSPKYGSISTIRKGQVMFARSSAAVDWIKDMLVKKIENQQALLLMMASGNENASSIDKAVERLADYKTKIRSLDSVSIKDAASSLRGWEGSASRIYFEEINGFIPQHLRFSTRSQHPAKDVANAFLNYGYGIVYGKIEAALVKAGIDPYVGIFHSDVYNKPVLVYDVIEQYRVWVDYVVINLLCQLDIDSSYFTIEKDGTCELEQLGRRVLVQAVSEYLDEIVPNDSLQRSRNTMIQLYANELAKRFSNFKG